MVAFGRASRALLVVGVVLFPALAAAQYTAVDLGSLPGAANSQALAVNDRGDAAGVSGFGFPTSAVMWTAEGLTDIGSIPPLVSTSYAHDINKRGAVVGHGTVFGPGSVGTHGFLYQDGVLTDLGTLPGETESYAVAINDRGEIAGISFTFFGQSHLVIWRDGAIHDLGVLPAGDANVTDMNNRRQIVGYATSSSGERAFTWRDGVVTYLPPLTEGGSSFAWAINDRGEIAGASYTPSGELHPVLWRDGVAIDLGTLPGSGVCQAEGLNDRGQVVGWCAIHATGTASAFAWEDGEMTAVGALPGGNYSLASAINDRGVIVGASLDATGTSLRPTMWIPVRGPGR